MIVTVLKTALLAWWLTLETAEWAWRLTPGYFQDLWKSPAVAIDYPDDSTVQLENENGTTIARAADVQRWNDEPLKRIALLTMS